MGSSKRQRQRQRRANAYSDANPYSSKPGTDKTNPNGAPQSSPPPLSPTPDLGMPDDMGDGTPPQDMRQAVSVRCFSCGAQDDVKLSTIAQIGTDGQMLRCKCGSYDLDVIDDQGDLVSAINALVTQVTELYLRIHLAHWNVAGPDFAEYHALFEKIYEDVYDSIDAHAENVRKLGGIVTIASIEGFGSEASAQGLTLDLAARNQQVIISLQSAFDLASEANEQGVANYLAERIDAHQKWQWQLSASEAFVASHKRTRAHVSSMLKSAASQRCDNCGYTVRGLVPDEQGWECPKCKEGTMQDFQRTANVLNIPPMVHYAPTTDEIMRTVNAIPLPIERRPPNQENDPANKLGALVMTILRDNPGLPSREALLLAYQVVGI